MKKACLTITSLFLFSILVLMSNGDSGNGMRKYQSIKKLNIGVILDISSRIGKEEKVAMEMAIVDYYGPLDQGLTLHFRNSRKDPIRAASYAKKLIHKYRVNAIIGLETWEEAISVAELGNSSEVPILCLANDLPNWASNHWPFLVSLSHNQYAQMKAVAAIIQSWQWRRVNLIYEDINSAINGIIPYLITSLHEVGSDIEDIFPIPPFPPYNLSSTLEKLKRGQCRVFIVHASIALATNLFMEANDTGMMEEEFVWITTNGIANQIDSLNASIISSMEGVLGIKSYFANHQTRHTNFSSRFQTKFRLEFPFEPYTEPGISALQAYDAVWALALAIKRKRIYRNPIVLSDGRQLLGQILKINFLGLSGELKLTNGMLEPGHIFRIVNVVGKSCRQIGFWSDGSGFSVKVSESGTKYNDSMKFLGRVYWPGDPWDTPRGWAVPTNANPIKIGVPATSAFTEFVRIVGYNHFGDPIVEGFCIDVFKAILKLLPYNLTYKLEKFEGPFDLLVQQVHDKKYDAVVGDTAAVANRCENAEFSLRYTEPGLQMVVYERHWRSRKAWLFKKPFTTSMWVSTVFISLFNGFVVWYIERKNNPHFGGNFLDQFVTTIWLSFTILFSAFQGDRTVHSNLSRMAMVVWIFVAFVIISSYSASLSSMLTIQGLKPTLVDIETLRVSNAKVGCNGNSFIVKYLEDVLRFDPNNIVKINSSDEYVEAFRGGKIAAAFLQVPYVKVLLAKYCNDFTTSGPTFKVGGFGFVFPKGSPMVPDISKAILSLSEDGGLQKLESSLTSSYNCSSASESSADDEHNSLGIDSFRTLFSITIVASTIALFITKFQNFFQNGPLLTLYTRQEVISKSDPLHDHEEDEHVLDSKHDPDNDENFMFASEMKNQ